MPYSASHDDERQRLQPQPLFVTVGHNPARPFGMDAAERARALAVKAGLESRRRSSSRDARPSMPTSTGRWDPEWLVALIRSRRAAS